MQVFRVCDKEEIDKIFNGVDFKNIGAPGSLYQKDPGEVNLNTHNYVQNERYMHFFPKFGSLFYVKLEKGRYICTYDIPSEILNEGLGSGEYLDLITNSFSRIVEEYCIKSKYLNFEYLEQVQLITRNMDYMSFLCDEPLDDFYESIYLKKKGKQK